MRCSGSLTGVENSLNLFVDFDLGIKVDDLVRVARGVDELEQVSWRDRSGRFVGQWVEGQGLLCQQTRVKGHVHLWCSTAHEERGVSKGKQRDGISGGPWLHTLSAVSLMRAKGVTDP